MTKPELSAPGADWTKLLSDPEVVSHLGELLQAYRDAPPDKRDQALLEVMRGIKTKNNSGMNQKAVSASPQAATSAASMVAVDPAGRPDVPVCMPASDTPPFEPDIFTPSWGQDRRRYPRMKCFVAVELRVDGTDSPVWGNLSNTSLGGGFVETPTPVPTGVKLEVGLWVANGKIWVKGMILNGIVTRSNPTFGVRVKFAAMESLERESLRHFLKFVEDTTKGYQYQQGYLAQMKR